MKPDDIETVLRALGESQTEAREAVGRIEAELSKQETFIDRVREAMTHLDHQPLRS